jgi:hypothetical protein
MNIRVQVLASFHVKVLQPAKNLHHCFETHQVKAILGKYYSLEEDGLCVQTLLTHECLNFFSFLLNH